ncbi:MAG: FHA domain-containing protein [Phycisphaerae bacterium]|nr:FHA domain-containing protein [Phycisphaerae bacterium]
MACIVVTSGPCRGDRYPLGHRTNVIGRAESLPIQVLDDRVSRKHLQIRFDSATGRYLALDMNSRNGVFINGVRLAAATSLRDRDRIRLGGTVLLFAQSDSDEDTMVWHRFKKAGEHQRPTHFDLSVEGRPAEPPVFASRSRPLRDLALIRDGSGVVYCL